MQVSVIIPAHSMDRWNTIIQAVASIKAQTLAAWEIIIAVGHNAELTRRLKEELSSDVRVVEDTTGSGPARTRNLGVKAARGEIIAFLEDDASADSHWLENLTPHYQDKRTQAVGGYVIPVWEGSWPWWFPEELFWVVGCTYRGHPTTMTDVRSLPGCNMSFRKQVFEQLGFFNTNFGRPGNFIGAEDTELFLRIHRQIPGARVIYEPGAIVYHHVPVFRQTIKYLIRRSMGEGIGRARLRFMYPGALSSESHLLRYFFRQSIPSRLSNILRGKQPATQLVQMLMIALSTFVTGVGFGSASITTKLARPSQKVIERNA